MESSRALHVGKGIKERLLHDEKVLGKGIRIVPFILFPPI